MHCPRCGTSAGEGQQFCRTCGLNLEKVAELVAESSPAERRGVESLRLKELQRKHESWGGIAGLITFALILVLFVTIVFSQIIMKGGLLILPGSLLILLAAGAGVMAYFQASAKSLQQKLAEPQLPQSTDDQLIDSPRIPPPLSVTDQTTRQLVEQNDRHRVRTASGSDPIKKSRRVSEGSS
jgi:hypothetical protein